jgi:hypothetical protein
LGGALGMIPVYLASLVIMLASPVLLWLSGPEHEPKPAKVRRPLLYAGRRRKTEPSPYARLKLRLRRRVAWIVLAYTLRYRLTIQFGG